MKLRSVSRISLLLCLAAVFLPAQTILNFNGANGANPQSAPIQAADGALYGVAANGGAHGGGTIFRIAGGTLTTIYSFCSKSGCQDGATPVGGLLQAADGGIWGSTRGLESSPSSFPATLFVVTPSGRFRQDGILTQDNYGIVVTASPIQTADGNIYWTAALGGPHNAGTIFNLTEEGDSPVHLGFCGRRGCPGGAEPVGGLVEGPGDDVYGTTYRGGSPEATSDGGTGFGTIFRVSPDNKLTTIYIFCLQTGCPDGWGPVGALVRAATGDLYGLTQLGGTGNGTVFKIAPDGTLTTLHNFAGPDGASPNALIQGSDGNFYGTTKSGGNESMGTVFEITPDGTLTTLFNANPSVGSPTGLGQYTDGKFIVSGAGGGTHGLGTIFVLDEGLGPFVKTQQAFGAVGAAVTILGTGLTGATSVTFNGTAAVFDVVSDFEITTTVPTGAGSGIVQVLTPGGALSSNTSFTVQ